MAGVVFFFGLLTYLILQREKEIILQMYKEKAVETSTLVAQNLVFMMGEKTSSAVAENIGAFNRVGKAQIGVVGPKGLPVFNTSLLIPPYIFSAQQEQYIIRGNDFLFFTPLRNEERCHACHNPADATRGMIVIKSSLAGARAEISATARRLLAFALFLGVTSEVYLLLLLRRMVLAPLRKLNEGAEILKSGRLAHRIDIRSGDEIGSLAEAFNQMAESVNQSHANLENAVRQKTRELQVIAGLSTEVFKGDLPLGKIIEQFMDAITDQMDFGYSSLCLVNPETGFLSQEFKKGIRNGLCTMEISLAGDHPFVRAIREARPSVKKSTEINAPDAFANTAIVPILSHQRKRCSEINLCSYEHCPAYGCADDRCWLIGDTLCRSIQAVAGNEKIYGCLHCSAFPVLGVLIAGKQDEISPSSLHSLEILASVIASAIENQRLIETKKEDISRLVQLHDISVGSLQTLGDTLGRSVVSAAAILSNMDAAVLWLKGDDGMLCLEEAYHLEGEPVPRSLSVDDSFVGASIREERPVETLEMGSAGKLGELVARNGFLYAASVPIEFKDSVLGCLTLFKKKDFFMTDSEKAITMLFASQAAAALNTSRLYRSLSESEEKYRAVMNDASDAILLFDTDGKLIEANRKSEELSGYSKKELLNMHYSRLVRREDEERVSAVFSETITSGSGEINNVLSLRKDGTNFPVDLTASVIEFADTKVVQTIIRDISERKRTEEVLYTVIQKISVRTGKDFFTSMVQHLARILNMDYAFVGELTEDGRVIRTIAVSAHGPIADNFDYTLAGTPCENVAGKKLCCYPGDVQRLFPGDRMLSDMGLESYIGVPLFDTSGKAIGIVAAVDSRPITNVKFAKFACQIFSMRAAAELERMRAEKTLTSEKEFSEAVFNSASSGIMVIDKDGLILKINRVGTEILRMDTADMVGGRITDIYPETRGMFLSDSMLGRETVLTRRDGTTIPVGFTSSPLSYPPDCKEGAIILFRDLSEIKKLQAELRKKEHFETIGKVISGVAHEIRNPLFGISSIGQILERELESPQHLALVQAMLKESGRMKRLIEELLLYTRQSRLELKDVDLGLLLEELKHYAKAKGNEISLSVNIPPLLVVRADRDKITQVLLNLMNNALDAARETITISAKTFDGAVELYVADDGPGIRKEDIDMIFDPFFTTKKGGTGLGLPICRKIIEDHGGSIDIRNAEKGAVVTIRLNRES